MVNIKAYNLQITKEIQDKITFLYQGNIKSRKSIKVDSVVRKYSSTLSGG